MSTLPDTTTHQGVPFFDLSPMHEKLAEGVLAGIRAVVEHGAFVNGPQVAEFERAFCAYCGTTHCVGVASGLDALRLGLLAADLEPGAEVIVPASTFVATLEAVTQAGLVPVPVDVSEVDYGLDVAAARAAVGARTHAIVPVHLYGQMADMRSLLDLAADCGVAIVEDAAQAHGASRDGLRAGAAGLVAAFSFYPAKNLGAMGDAGAIVTNDESIAQHARALREHGQTRKYVHDMQGYTARLDTFQAVVLLEKLRYLDDWNAHRSRVAAWYAEGLQDVGDLRLPLVAENSIPAWHLYVVRTAEPQRLGEFLAERGIGTGRHYPSPVHLTGAYEQLGYREGSFPVSEALSRECLSLPLFPGLDEIRVQSVIDTVREYFSRG